MPGLKAIIDALDPIEGGWRATIPATWQQGRTAYGGVSAALALHAAQASDVDLPPLRSALVAFVGPLSGTVTVRASRLRRGRNAAFIQADVEGEAGLGLRATFVFMAPMPSRIDHRVETPLPFPVPGPDAMVHRGHPAVAFSQNFDLVDDVAGTGPAEWRRWVRLHDRAGLDPAVEMIAVADCLPPAALKLAGGFAPVSSMTWQLNLVGGNPATHDGWWLLHSGTDHARDGNSSQRMAIWNTEGACVAEQMQSVAVFG
ncbi:MULTISPECIES: acyl-CoA thioesterase II [unclassified Sphingomonas]|uniref:acyl-CoA thioesterase n=1 Tax=unclassified Sphingomonas TaxID=196159 RepID=UPI000E10846E|nr:MULTISPECIES: thioesterase family protein [unclassified Sphingomonas]AXJ94136.1 thioesterase family protein [Sphingomonas sp. FARSPH]